MRLTLTAIVASVAVIGGILAAQGVASTVSAGFGYAASRPADRRTGLTPVHEAIAAVPEFGAATETWFPWARECDRSHWLDLLLSRSDHAALDAAVRERLFEAIAEAIGTHGGSFVMSFETGLITATPVA